MITDRDTEARIRSWLLASAPNHLPDHVLADTFARTRLSAQASRRRAWGSLAGRFLPTVFVGAALAIILVTVGVGFGNRQPSPYAFTYPGAAQVSGQWTADTGVAVTIERDPADDRVLYWRAVTYDQVDLNSWISSDTSIVERHAGARPLRGMADDVEGAWLESVTATIRPGSFAASTVLSPGTPVSVDRRVRVTTVGRDGYMASVNRDGGGPYTVTALVPKQAGAAMLTASALRASGTEYPSEVVDLYTTQQAGVFGPNLASLRDEILQSADSTAPYDIARRLVEVLHGPTYEYDTDVRDLDCSKLSTGECFATFKRGHCMYYATTMAVILRNLGIPARLVAGFLPGERAQGSSTEVIRYRDAHAWVEVYFPGYEWVAFDPTGGGVARLPAPLP